MRRYAAVALLLGTLSGCMNLDTGPETGGRRPLRTQGAGPPMVPGVEGPYGAPVPMAAPYNTAPPSNQLALQMMQHSVPLSMVQMNNPAGMMGGMTGGPPGSMMPRTPMPANGLLSPPGMPANPNLPPGGAGAGTTPPGDIQQAQFAMNPANAGLPLSGQRTQVRFLRPTGMQVSWFALAPDGRPTYSSTPIETPGKYNFSQGARYRLKLTKLPGRPGVELYPTLEVFPGNHKTDAFLAHSSVPIEFTDEDFKQIAEGNYVVKVIYLPDPNFQDVAGTGTDEILSTRLEPGQDPVQEALRRGSILLVIRMGNIDQEAPNTPPLGAPTTDLPRGMPGGMPPGMAPGMPPGMAPPMRFGPTQPGVMTPPVQVPYWGMGPKGPLNMAPGAVPPGMMPPGMMPQGTMPRGMMPPGMMPPGALPPGAMPPGMMPPGALPPGAMPPGAAPPGQFPPMPNVVPPGGVPSLTNAAAPAAPAGASSEASPRVTEPTTPAPASASESKGNTPSPALPPLPASTPEASGDGPPAVPPAVPAAQPK